MKPLAVRTRFVDPYRRDKSGRYVVNIPNLRENDQSGVYLIRSKSTEKIIYVGYSASQLYKTITRHFQTWNDRAQERFVYNRNRYQVRVIYTTASRAALLEKYLIQKMKPRDNTMKYKSYLTPREEITAGQVWEGIQPITASDECPF